VADESAIARRTFLARAAALGAAGAGLIANSPAPGGHRTQSTAADFAPFVGTTFRVRPGKGKLVDLTLAAVEKSRATSGDRPKGMREPFSLLFRGPKAILQQRTYTVEHARFGTLQLFLVPVEMPKLGHYEAVFG